MTLRVLLVDDDELVCRSIARSLTYHGYEVTYRTRAVEALDVLADKELDVVLSDIMMPELDGWQLLERLKERRPNLPVVLFTGSPLPGFPERAKRMGAVDLLAKPLTPATLIDALRHATGRGPSEEGPS